MPESIHTVVPGDTLTKIAAANGTTLAELLAINLQITNPDIIAVGQQVKLPKAAALPTALPVLPGQPQAYDGQHPAPGTLSGHSDMPVHPPLTNAPGARDPDVYAQVINQFAVGVNPRYTSDGETYCNIFVWDVTQAMGAEIPHWVDATGDGAKPNGRNTWAILINASIDWMHNFGVVKHGWTKATAAEAQKAANAGEVAVAMWYNPTGAHGHTAIVRPGTITDAGPSTAQAGAINFNDRHLKDGFHNAKPEFFVHE